MKNNTIKIQNTKCHNEVWINFPADPQKKSFGYEEIGQTRKVKQKLNN